MMGLWYCTPTDDPAFIAGKREASTEELQEAIMHLEGLQDSGFTMGMRIKTLRTELNGRRDRQGGNKL